MQTQAILKFVRLSPKKALAIADLVRGKPVDEASNILKYSTRNPARILCKVLESAIANDENNYGADVDEQRVTETYIDQGPSGCMTSRSPLSYFSSLRRRVRNRCSTTL